MNSSPSSTSAMPPDLPPRSSDRSRAIVTFALCGFANFSSIAIQMAVTGGLAPNQRPVIARLGIRALIAGSLANLMSAALAGLLISGLKQRHGYADHRPHRFRLADRRRPRPDAFADELGRSFEEYGFAVIGDHGIPRRADPPRRGQGEGVLRAARRGEAQIFHPRRRRRARLHAVRDRDRQGRRPPTTSRNSGTSAASCRPATSSAATCRTTSGRRKCRASRTPSSSSTRRSTARASRS